MNPQVEVPVNAEDVLRKMLERDTLYFRRGGQWTDAMIAFAMAVVRMFATEVATRRRKRYEALPLCDQVLYSYVPEAQFSMIVKRAAMMRDVLAMVLQMSRE